MFHAKLDELTAQGLTAIDFERALPEVSRQTAQKWLKGDKKGKRSVPDGITMLWLIQRLQWTPEDIVGALEGPQMALGGPQAALGQREDELRRELNSVRLERIKTAAAAAASRTRADVTEAVLKHERTKQVRQNPQRKRKT